VREIEKERSITILFHKLERARREVVFALAAFRRGRFRHGVTGMIEIEALICGQKARATEVPFADARGRVAGVVQALGKSPFRERQLLFNERMKKFLRHAVRPSREIRRQVQAGRRLSGQDRRARRRADRLGDVGAREARAFGGEAVEVWRVMFATAITGEIVRTEVIGENEDDVGTRRRGGREYRQRGERPNREKKPRSFHGFAGFFPDALDAFPAPPPVT
jgi:hypothetical protein